MNCEGCTPGPSSLTPPPVVVGGRLQNPQEEAAGVIPPEAFAGMPPFAQNLIRWLHEIDLQVKATQRALVKRHLLTEQELQEATAEIVQAQTQLMQVAREQLGRGFAQRPTIPSIPHTRSTVGGHDDPR